MSNAAGEFLAGGVVVSAKPCTCVIAQGFTVTDALTRTRVSKQNQNGSRYLPLPSTLIVRELCLDGGRVPGVSISLQSHFQVSLASNPSMFSSEHLGRHRNGLTAVKEFRDKAGPQDSPHSLNQAGLGHMKSKLSSTPFVQENAQKCLEVWCT